VRWRTPRDAPARFLLVEPQVEARDRFAFVLVSRNLGRRGQVDAEAARS
jgi:hypothetical protein